MNANEILAIAEFVGEDMSDEQAEKLMNLTRQLSIADREYLYLACHQVQVASKFYTELSINRCELRWWEHL